MPVTIMNSVGLNANNASADVKSIQELLNANRHLLIPFEDLPVDGSASPALFSRIETFQRRVQPGTVPDGRGLRAGYRRRTCARPNGNAHWRVSPIRAMTRTAPWSTASVPLRQVRHWSRPPQSSPVPYPGPCVARAVGQYRPLVGDDPGLIGRSCRCPRPPACSTALAVAIRWRSAATATAATATAVRTARRPHGGRRGARPGWIGVGPGRAACRPTRGRPAGPIP